MTPPHDTTDPSPRASDPRVRGRPGRFLLPALIAFAGARVSGEASAHASTVEGSGRVIVLGFDGADARTVAEMMDRGELPHLARLRDSGTFAPLRTTIPAESPVSWASLNSGQNPAKTGIPGFVKRSLSASGDPLPDLGFFRVEDRPLRSFELPPPLGFLARFPPLVTGALCGAVALVGFVLLFVFLLRFRKTIALPLAVLLGAAGGWAGYKASRGIPDFVPDVVANLVRTGGFWEVAARAGVPSVVLDGPMSWDRPGVPGAKVLAGLGVPDARGSYGDWFVYTTDPAEFSREPEGRQTSVGGTVFRVDEIEGRIETSIFGPHAFESPVDENGDPRPRARLSVPLVIVRADGDRVRVRIDGVEHEMGPGEWSPWYHPTFEVSSLIKVHAITRVKVLRTREPFELYLDFLQIDPSSPPFWQPVSQPPEFVSQLARETAAPFDTVGWACLTMPLKDLEIDPKTFLEDVDATRADRERLLRFELGRPDWRLLFAVEGTPDRVQHMMYQFYDREHPMYAAEKAAQKVRFAGEEIALSDAIPAAYRQIDRLVGEVLEAQVRSDDTLILCADHGFQSFRRGLNLNNWLAEHGYLKTVDLRERRQGGFLQFVDWSRTKAYAVGLGMIFVNLRGRERDGIVDPVEVPKLLEEISRELLETRDGDKSVVRVVHRMSEIHAGPHLDLESDLMVGLEAGYRVGWSTTTGGMQLVQAEGGGWKPAPSIDDNTNNWSGDHVSVAQELVPGIFFCNRKVEIPAGGVDLLDIAPTVLTLLGVPIPAEYDRPPLRVAR
jgi:predicted AlkP superfamily phosphohydrolase/phosphomutase